MLENMFFVYSFDIETFVRWRVDAVIRYKALKEYYSYPHKISILSVEEYQSFEHLESTGIISKGEQKKTSEWVMDAFFVIGKLCSCIDVVPIEPILTFLGRIKVNILKRRDCYQIVGIAGQIIYGICWLNDIVWGYRLHHSMYKVILTLWI